MRSNTNKIKSIPNKFGQNTIKLYSENSETHSIKCTILLKIFSGSFSLLQINLLRKPKKIPERFNSQKILI